MVIFVSLGMTCSALYWSPSYCCKQMPSRSTSLACIYNCNRLFIDAINSNIAHYRKPPTAVKLYCSYTNVMTIDNNIMPYIVNIPSAQREMNWTIMFNR